MEVWGRPVGVTVAKDGSLLVSDGRVKHYLAWFHIKRNEQNLTK